MKKTMAILICLAFVSSVYSANYTRTADGEWSELGKWWTNQSGSWGAATMLPPTDASVVLNANRILGVDVNATVAGVQVVNTADGATLDVDTGGTTLTVSGTYGIGNATTAGNATVNHTAGTVNAFNLIVGSATGGSGTYTLSGGNLNVTGGGSTINSTGLLDINGGTLSIDNTINRTLGGDGLVKLQSGRLTSTGAAAISLGADMEISGGTLDTLGQTRLGGNLKIIGDGATIALELLGSNAGSSVDMVFGATGISTVTAAGWMTLNQVALTVDARDYAGSETSFDLFTCVNNSALLLSYNVIGLGTEGVDWELVQTTGVTGDDGIVLNIIPEPATFGLLFFCGGGMLFIRRVFQ